VNEDLPGKDDKDGWPVLRDRYTELFKSKTRDEWCAELEGTDVCFAPVLPMSEAADHPHIKARNTIVEANGIVQPAPAPRFSRTPGAIQRPGPKPGQHTDEALADWGFTSEEIAKLRDAKAIA
jgi:alpha-methylacyl-CoA racemase